MTAREAIQKDSRVAPNGIDVSEEDGIWVHLKVGYSNGNPSEHIIHEDTWKEVRRCMKSVKKCDCRECEQQEA